MQSVQRSAWDRLVRLRRQRRVQNILTLGLTVLGPVLALATFLVLGPMGEGADSTALRLILLADFVYFLLLAGLIVMRLVQMIAARRARTQGSRLGLRLTGVFAGVVETVQELFTAARSEFRHIEIFYFHNCIYEALWKSARRRRETATPTREVMNRLGRDWRCVIVGDASMSPYEITHVGGANETWNPEPGALWLQRIRAQWPRSVWLNPVPRAEWKYTPSISMIEDIFEGDMLPLTLEGLGRMTKVLG